MSVTVDVTARSLNKHAEYLCGDTTELLKTEDSDVIILADGMGSGVRASILSTLTAKILGTMFAGGATLEQCLSTIVNTLPIEKRRKVAYSTFTILQICSNGNAYLVNYDNPDCIFLRKGKPEHLPMRRRVIHDREVTECRFHVDTGDMLMLMSDGVTHAGVGTAKYAFGWPPEEITKFVETKFANGASSVRIATAMADRCRQIYGGINRDDTTVVVARIIQSEVVNLMTGPPRDMEDDPRIVADFMADPEAKKVVAGGTSATILSRELGRPLRASLDYFDPDIPPMAKMDGIDLVTEGILTLRKAVELLEQFKKEKEPDEAFFRELDRKNGASMIAKLLIEDCTDLNMFIGTAVNNAYQNPDLPIDLGIRQILVKRLIAAVRALGKRVNVRYY
ncbi:SpoIIE family protein phosphatase [Clostridium vitabionis]|uniref:SpoIIE family protein phosphatase n=1 Tax=Clostridium vitabionis TaxID=2784388 RepID=UPI00188D3256|nr:SpoIIE family protein phosphatase [Clostridium vitabionis]